MEGLSTEVIIMTGVELKSDKEGVEEKMWLKENEKMVGSMNCRLRWSQILQSGY